VIQGLREARNGETLSTPIGVLVLFCSVWEKGNIIHAEGVRLLAAGALNGEPVGQSQAEIAIVIRASG
jgi:hypothetical protein